jgi:hypothetical protein
MYLPKRYWAVELHRKDHIFAMTGHSSWFGIFAGALAILLGVYSLLRFAALDAESEEESEDKDA